MNCFFPSVLICHLIFIIPGIGQENSLFDQGEVLWHAKDFEKAYEVYNEAYGFFKEAGNTRLMLKALHQMGKCKTHSYEMEEGLDIYHRLETEARTSNNLEFIGLGINSQIALLRFFSRDEETREKCRQLLEIEGLDQDIYSDTYTVLGELQTTDGRTAEGYETLLKAYRIDTTLRDSSSLPFMLAALAMNRRAIGQYGEAVDFYFQAISSVPKNQAFKYATLHGRLGVLFSEIGNFDKAAYYLDKAINFAIETKQKGNTAKSRYSLAAAQRNAGNIAESIQNSELALAAFEEQGNKKFIYYTLHGLAESYILQDELKLARDFLDRASKIRGQIEGDELDKFHLNNHISLMFELGDLESAGAYLDQALSSITSFENIRHQMRTYQLAEKYYLARGQLKKAYNFNRKYYSLKDSAFQMEQSYMIHDLEGKYQKAEQDLALAEIAISEQSKTVKLARQQKALEVGAVGLLSLVLITMVSLRLYRTKKRSALILVNKNEEVVQALADREILLKEIHHRVKNNLQVVSSLLRLQSRSLTDQAAQEALIEGRNRVQSMALIHQNLYQDESNLGAIEVSNYLGKLTNALISNYQMDPGKVQLSLDVESLMLDVDTAIPIGLIVNELVSNSLKYAFPNGSAGNIRIHLKESSEKTLDLSIEDDGIGYDPNTISPESFGHRLIIAFSERLSADYEFTGIDGAKSKFVIHKYKIAA